MPTIPPSDLLKAVIQADDRRRKVEGKPSTRAARQLESAGPSVERRLVEPVFNLVGHAWAFLMALLPAFWRRPLVQWINLKLGNGVPLQNPTLAQRVQQTVAMARALREKTGQWPACLVLTSHPETEGPFQWLRFELMRQGLQMADAVVEARSPGSWYPRHPKCFLAIDPYALDTVSAPVAGFYSGWMHRLYLAWDRQPATQSWWQRHVLLRKTGLAHIAWRLLMTLRADHPVVMVLAGGLPFNARLLYAAREFVHYLPIVSWRVRKNAAKQELMTLLSQPGSGPLPLVEGLLSREQRDAVGQSLISWGLPEAQVESRLQAFEEEFRRPVPYRTRLFRVLLRRLVARGKPLLLIALSHQEKEPYITIGEPVAVTTLPSDVAAFARDFVRSHF